MANEQSGCPLRRWRPFYGAFGAIDDAIEEAGGHPREAFREMRVPIVKLLRAATDDGVAEQLCAALDEAMAEALETLRVAPVPRSAVASSDLRSAVGNLGNHGSARIRRLAGDVVHKLSAGGDRIPRQGFSAAIADDGTAAGHKEKLHVQPAKMLPAADEHKKKLHTALAKKMLLPTVPVAEANKKKVSVPPPAKMLQKTTTVSTPSKSVTKKPAVDESEKMEATKRKLREGYDEAKRIKRQRLVQKIDDKVAAKMFQQKQQKIVRGRAPATCRSRISSVVKRSLLPSLQMI